MAPKPFNPPRPVASSIPSSAQKKTASRSKIGKGKSINSKGKRGDDDDDDENDNDDNSGSIILRTPANKRSKIDRNGSASTIRLPSLSPGTSDDEDEEGEEEAEEDQEDDTHMENLGTDGLDDDDDEDDDNIDDFVNDSDNSDAINDPFGSNPNTLRHRRENRSRRRAEDNEGNEKRSGINLEDEDMFISRNLVSILLNEKFKQETSSALAGTTTTTKTNTSLEDEGRGSKRKGSEKGQIRMTEQAVGAVRKYLDTFAREAIARAAWESVERGGTGLLEIEDLERLAPQLVLDF
ncbi:hypothetical protein GcM3_059019 [Golovinomyces cichoracearum]|uniref:Centromere protein X n=1 Tax=Golovinomyces cichoracearum TaxID=62708 RepID=A0A420IWX5_9PEZI|nr:hypothetical protein GcM3_059019 [Golovinomyces cichoracearum]